VNVADMHGFERLNAWASLDSGRRCFEVLRGQGGLWSVSLGSTRWRNRRRSVHSAKGLSDAAEVAIKEAADWRMSA
jgi:hypothetical protein